MRLICPNCQQTMTVPDAGAGKTVVCSHCQHSFPAPQLYSLAPIEAPPPPPPLSDPPVLPADPTPIAPPDKFTAPRTASEPTSMPPILPGYFRFRSLSLNRRVCLWLVPICLTLILLLTFFNWVSFSPAGHAAYSQNAWQALFAVFSVDPVAEKVFGKEKELNDGLRASMWLLPYIILLFAGLVVAWIEPARKSPKLKLPPVFESFLRHRQTMLLTCVGLTLFLLLLQWAVGFGLQNSLQDKIPTDLVEEQKAAKTPEEIQIVQMKIVMETRSVLARPTCWLRIVVLLHLVALGAVLGEMLLLRRGDKPPPRAGVMY